MKTILPLTALVAFVVILLTCTAGKPGFAQSADDGFNPNVRGSVHAIAVQTDGKTGAFVA